MTDKPAVSKCWECDKPLVEGDPHPHCKQCDKMIKERETCPVCGMKHGLNEDGLCTNPDCENYYRRPENRAGYVELGL